MRFLKYVSPALFVLLCGCARNPYRKLTEAATPSGETRQLLAKPKLRRELYRCVVDGRFLFKSFHLSGVLLFKSFEDGSQRAVFQNELGISFFNFKWDATDSFAVTSVMPQLNKPAVIRILRTDFELLLRKNLDTTAARYLLSKEGNAVVQVAKNNGAAWYTAGSPQIAYGGRSLVTSMEVDSANAGALPSGIRIKHHRANFTIDLSRITTDEN
jgi:hypothetical protein